MRTAPDTGDRRIPSGVARRSRIPSSAWKMLVFTAVTLVLLGVLGTLIGNVSFVERRTFYATFTDVTGVLQGDRVRLSGVEVGSVTEIELSAADDGRQHARIAFTVRDGVPVYRSAHLELRFENIVGQRYLAIEEEPGDGAQMAEGETFPVAQTSPALSLTQLFNGFQPLLRALDPEQTNRLSFQMVRAFQGEAGTFAALLDDTASLTSTIADKDQVIGEVVANLNSVLTTVGRRDQELTALIVRFRDLMTGLSGDRDTISAALPDLADLLDGTAGLIGDVRAPLAETISGLAKVAHELGVRRAVLEDSLQLLPQKLRLMARTGSYGSYFNFYVCGAEVRVNVLGGTMYLGTPGVASNERDSVCAKADGP
ncbi:MAG: MCE family protein [Actinobacteria bacterium]|uniref:Unannotated protein n=1 Tax=freshwater metagenome TaxID=449393 RepID=A0A6J6PU30_9ZZZZ|nr:MCE family protein [Actinomycetota bacterium]